MAHVVGWVHQLRLDWNGWRGVGQDANGTVGGSHPELRSSRNRATVRRVTDTIQRRRMTLSSVVQRVLVDLGQPGPQGVPEQSLTEVAP